MQQNVLLDIMKSLKQEHNLTDYQLKMLKAQLKHFKNGKYIYPGHWKSLMHISMKQSYAMLDEILTMGYLSVEYEIHCPNCHQDGVIVKNMRDFLRHSTCNECNREMNFFDDAIRIYKVINCD